MNTIKLNNVEFEVESYSKTTYFNADNMNSNGNCILNISDMAALNAIAQEPITSIQIYNDDVLIYNLQNINAKIENINEYLNGSRMSINVYFTFDETIV